MAFNLFGVFFNASLYSDFEDTLSPPPLELTLLQNATFFQIFFYACLYI